MQGSPTCKQFSKTEHFEYQGTYLDLLDQVHRHLRPRTYIEVGVSLGRSITLVQPETQAIGIDPDPRIERPLTRNTRIYAETSDQFFERGDLHDIMHGRSVDLAFIDGMHHFEFAFRDFRNIERLSTAQSVILIHDCLPPNADVADRNPVVSFWAGDVWKLLLCLHDRRPDLTVHVVSAGPTGLGIVTGLDPTNRVLWDEGGRCIDDYLPFTYDDFLGRANKVLHVVPNDWDSVHTRLPHSPFQVADLSVDRRKVWPRTLRAQRRRSRVWLAETRIAAILRWLRHQKNG